MYTFLVDNHNALNATIKQRIMHRSSLVDDLHFLVPPTYESGQKTYNMSDFTCVLEYVLPISRKYVTEILVLSEGLYKEYLEYLLPVDTKITSEAGKVELKLTFTQLEMDAEGNTYSHVRKTSSSVLNVIPVETWSDYIASTDLDSIAQIMLNLQAKIDETQDIAEAINTTKADDIMKETNTDGVTTIQLVADGNPIGNKVQLENVYDNGVDIFTFDSEEGDTSDDDEGDVILI